MQKLWKKTSVLLTVVTGISALMFLFFNIKIVEKRIVVNKRMLTGSYSEKVKESDVTGVVAKENTAKPDPCAEMTMPTVDEKTGNWQAVDNDSTAFIFSAYFIHESRKIVIIGMKNLQAGSYFCQFWLKSKRERDQYKLSYETVAKENRLPEGHGQEYSAILFECLLNSRSNSTPSYVSMVDKNCTAPRNILFIQHVTKPEAVSRNFTVCLPPIYGHPNIYRFIEWIEFNIILGADRFVVYNYTNDINVHKVLEYYSNKGFLTVIQWNLPESETETEVRKPISIHYFGQVAALNDCLYRNKYVSEFVINIDFDEFIIPRSRNDTTWLEMLSNVNQNEAVYIVQNTFFKVEWDNANVEISNSTLVKKYQLITMQKLQHEQKIFSPGSRSKYFARTSRVHTVMIHTIPRLNNFPLPVDVALLHHYRDFETKNDPESSKILDCTVPNKFGNILIKKVMAVWSELNKTLSVHL